MGEWWEEGKDRMDSDWMWQHVPQVTTSLGGAHRQGLSPYVQDGQADRLDCPIYRLLDFCAAAFFMAGLAAGFEGAVAADLVAGLAGTDFAGAGWALRAAGFGADFAEALPA